MLGKKMRFSNRQIVFKTRPEQDDAELTDDYLVDRLVLCGTVNRVVDQILALREEAGDFGELVYAGMDWVDPALAGVRKVDGDRVSPAHCSASQQGATMRRMPPAGFRLASAPRSPRSRTAVCLGAAVAEQAYPRRRALQSGSTIDVIGRIVQGSRLRSGPS
jgi:hypothetical protein